MKTHRNETTEKKKKQNGTGFYIALAVCIVTIAAAAWTTYGSLAGDGAFVSDESSISELKVENDVSGQSYEKSEPESSIADEISEQSEAAESSVQSSGSGYEPVQTSETAGQKVFMPIENAETMKGYSGNNLVFSRTTTDWRTHKGIDIKAESGTAVRAVSDGVIQSIEKDPKFGNIIVIEHDGYTARYCGLTDSPVVQEGDHIEAGSVIGYIGIVPCEQLDGTHLHLEIIVGNSSIDPMQALVSTK